MKRALLALILALPLAVSAQFRIVGTGLFTTLNDSTYRAKIDFRPDLTGNSYNATQLNDSMLVLSQKGQLYRLDSFYNASFSSAFIIVVEKNGNWGSPVGQVMVFQNNSSLAAPQAVYGANGATAGMQAGVDTWNSLLLKVVSDSAVYWNQAYSNSIDSLNVSGDTLKTITLYRASGDSISATFVDGGGSGPVTDTLTGEVKGPLDSTYIDIVANINFTTTTDTTVGVGELEYNDTQGSLIQGLKGGNVTNVIGQQIHQRVTNDTGSPLTKGTAVFLHGSQGNRITVRKALATVDSTSANTFGIVAESIANNQSGYVITEGLITNMNTNALTEGAAVYLSPTVAGELTTTKPQAPQHTVYIGVCVKKNAGSGELFVKIRNGQELDELHDVRITSPDSSASLYYNAAQGVWRDTTAAALKSDISGTTNYLAKFTGSNAVGNSVAFNTGRNLYINSTQDNSASSLSNSFQFNGYGSNAFDQPKIGVFGNTGTNPNHRPYLAMYRSFGDTANSKTLVPYNSYLGSIVWHGADGVNLASRGAEIGAITDSITGVTDMPTALFFGTTANGAASPTERMRITSPGNVGINTTNPVYRLHVDGEAGIELFSNTTNGRVLNFRPSLPASKYIQSISAEDLASVGAATGLSINAGGGVAFSTNSSTSLNERMRITNTGNVGINTTTPAYRLDVNGDVNTTGMYKKSGTDIISGTTNYIPKFTGANTIGNSGFIENGQEVYLGGTTNAFNFSRFSIYYNPRNNGFPIVSDTRSYATYTGAGDLITPSGGWSFGGKYNSSDELTAFASIQGKKEDLTQSRKGSMIFSINDDTPGDLFPKERMRITSAGNVGIGLNNPVNRLDVEGAAAIGATYAGSSTAPTNGLLVEGNVGIGTASPLSTPVGIGLTLGTISSGRSLYMVSSSDGNNGLIQFKDPAGADALQIAGTSTSNWLYGYGSRPLRFFTNATEVMRIEAPLTGLGNVGIHTSSPSRPLHVAGTTAIRIPVGNLVQRGTSDNGDIRVRTDTASMEYYSGAWRTVAPMARVPQSGLANRFSKFDANGLLDTSAVLVQANGRIGIWNTPVASDSVLTVTGGIRATTGVRATQLNVNTSGTQVLSINNYSGNPNVSPNNVFIGNGGQSATGLGTQGRNNVGIGANALLSITTGEGSIGIGTNTMALRAQIMQSNIAIGNNAMQAQGSVQNNDNTAIGTNALRYNKGGNYNVALGSNALTQNTASFNNDTAGVNSGSNNFALGFYSCYWNGAGLQNIGIGSTANYFNRNGSYNIAIGGSALAGGSSDADTIAKNNNVVIGTQALQFLKGNGTGNSDENVAIGHYAGRSFGSGAGTNFTAGKTSVYIGAYTRANANTNENEVVIGYSAIGNGSNTTTIGNSSTTNTVIPAGSLTVDVMRRKAPVTVTGNHTVAASTSWLICNGTAAIALTLPTASSWTGREIMVKTIQPYAVNSASSNVVPIDGVATGTAILPATDGAWCTLVSDGTNWIIMQRGS